MNNQRKKLAVLANNQRYYFRATYSRLSHTKEDKKPVALLQHVYLVSRNGNYLQVKDNAIKPSKKPYKLTDHAWVRFTINWLKLPYELKQGDLIGFTAKVGSYNIVRDDVLGERNEVWFDAKAYEDKMYQDWKVRMRYHPEINRKESLKKLKQQQQDFVKFATAEQKKIKLIDYELRDLDDLKLIKPSLNYPVSNRDKYVPELFKKYGYQYTYYLMTKE